MRQTRWLSESGLTSRCVFYRLVSYPSPSLLPPSAASSEGALLKGKGTAIRRWRGGDRVVGVRSGDFDVRGGRGVRASIRGGKNGRGKEEGTGERGRAREREGGDNWVLDGERRKRGTD